MTCLRCGVIIIALLAFNSVLAQELGTLDRFFTSRSMRKQLNVARDQYKPKVQRETVATERFQDQFVSDISVQGLIIRSDGSSEVWVNNTSTIGKARSNDDLRDRVQRSGTHKVTVTLPEGGEIDLKPGQSYLLDGEQVLDNFQLATTIAEPESEPQVLTADLEDTEDAEAKEEQADGEKSKAEFDESVLAETDSKIKLLEERIQKLEQER